MTANRSPDSGDTAVSDADLIRYLDGELTLDERIRLDGVLAGDDALTQRLGVLRRRSARLSTLLAAANPSTFETAAANPARKPDRRTVTRSAPSLRERAWLRAAIFVIAILSGALVVPPVRAWITDRLERVVGTDPAPSLSMPPPLVPAAPTDNFGVAFAVDGSTFTIEITAAQSGGRLIVRSNDGTEASAEVQGRWSSESFLVNAPNHILRIQNTAESVADYVITLPVSVRDVSVRLANGTTVPITLGSGISERVIELSR